MDGSILFGLLGILLAIVVFSFLCYKGIQLYIAVIVAVAIVCLTNGLDITEAFMKSYFPRFTAYLAGYWWIFVGSAMFGSVINVTGGSIVLGRFVIEKMGKWATLGLTIVFTILQYCGVSVLSGAVFAVWPMILTVYKDLDIPRRFAPSVICFSSLTLAVSMPGATAPHNLIPTSYFSLPLTAGAVIGIVCMLVMLFLGQFVLDTLVTKAKARGEHFVERAGDFPERSDAASLPPLWRVVIALAAYPLCVNLLPFALFFCQLTALAIALAALWGYWKFDAVSQAWKTFVPQSISIQLGQCAVMGFGGVFTTVAAYKSVVDWLINIPGTPLISCAISTTLMAGLTGSATSGFNLTLPTLGPIWAQSTTVPMAAFARVTGLSSLVLDSLPHNGGINGMLIGIKETMKDCYIPIFWLTVVVPAVGTILMIVLFSLFPWLP